MLPHHSILLIALSFLLILKGNAESVPDASDCLQGFADVGALPVNVTTDNDLLYTVLPSGLHLFPKMKFLCDGSVQNLQIGLFYTTAVHDAWEKVPRVELLQLLSAGQNYRNCSDDTLNCYRLSFRIEQNLSSNVEEGEAFDYGCSGNCVQVQSNTILTLSVDFGAPMKVKRGDYFGLDVPTREHSYEDSLPVIYTGSNYESPFIVIPQGSFIPSPGWEEQLALSSLSKEANESADYFWATGVIVGILLIAVVVIVIPGTIIVILWRRIKHTNKLNHKQHHECAIGNVAELAGGSLLTENTDRAFARGIVDAGLTVHPLPVLPSQGASTEVLESAYWSPADSEEGIYQQVKEKRFPRIIDKLVSLENKLGEGEFGEVYRCLWKLPGRCHSIEVAVKIPKGNSVANRIRVLQEVAILGQFNHPRVTRLWGLVTLCNPIMMVMELLPNGDLSDHVKKFDCSPKDPDLPKKLLQFCLEIADGMSYLSKKGFIHRDLAARNILLDKEWHCKITDFGMSQSLDENACYTITGGCIPLRWTAPEAILYGRYTAKSDVWSYGMVMYEIWSLGHKPFEDFSVEEILEALKSAYRQPPPPGCPRDVYEVMVDCWTPTYDDRPDFPSLISILQKVERDLDGKEIFHSGEDASVTLKLGAPPEEGVEIKELQDKHLRSNPYQNVCC